MTDRQLKYLLTLADEGNLTAAARKLFISQPSLSNLLSHVEEQLGVKLFDRDAYPLKPTYAGECYLTTASKILGAQRDLEIQIDEILQSKKGRLIIGCGSRLLPIILPEILPPFMKNYPGIQIQLVENVLHQLVERLETGNLDLIISNRPVDNENFGHVSLYQEEAMLYTPKGFLEQRKIPTNVPINLPDLSGCSFVLMNTGSVFEMNKTIFAEYGFSPVTILESSDWKTCVAIVSEGIACTILPTRQPISIEKSAQMNCYHLSKRYFRDTSIYYRTNYHHPQIMQDFLHVCHDVFGEISSDHSNNQIASSI